MIAPVTCLRCGHEFTSASDEAQLDDRDDSVISVKCPQCGKLNPATHIL